MKGKPCLRSVQTATLGPEQPFLARTAERLSLQRAKGQSQAALPESLSPRCGSCFKQPLFTALDCIRLWKLQKGCQFLSCPVEAPPPVLATFKVLSSVLHGSS